MSPPASETRGRSTVPGRQRSRGGGPGLAPFIATVDLLCWGAFAAVWAVGAIDAALHGGRPQRRVLAGGWWLLLVCAWFLLRSPASIWGRLAIPAPWAAPLAVAGAALLVACTAFTLWARLALGRMWSTNPTVREGHELRTTGPYALTRHPIYTGLLGMLAGTALVGGGGRMVALGLLAVLYIAFKARAEERLMADTFGARYAEYRRRTPRLLPWPRPPRATGHDPLPGPPQTADHDPPPGPPQTADRDPPPRPSPDPPAGGGA